jgi:hypothetical protein
MSEWAKMGTIERAFQLAREGACHSINDIRDRLLREGYPNVLSHTAGVSIKKQLKAILVARGAGQSSDNENEDLEP